MQAHGTEPRPAAASDEGGDEGDVVRHRAGYGDDGVRTERETAGRAGAFHRQRVGDERGLRSKETPSVPLFRGKRGRTKVEGLIK